MPKYYRVRTQEQWDWLIKDSIFSESVEYFNGHCDFELTGFSWFWVFIASWGVIPGTFMFVLCTANAIAPEIALIGKLLSK